MASEQSSSQRAKILIVEDDIKLLETFNELLKDEFDVVTAGSAEKADKIVFDIYKRGGRISLAIVDINLPIISGTDFARRLLDLDQEIGLIHITGAPIAMASLPYQAHDCLQKPIRINTLFESIRLVFDKIGTNKNHKQKRLNRWRSFIDTPGLSSIKLVSHTAKRDENESVEKFYCKCMSDDSIFSFDAYKYPERTANTIKIGLASTIGCNGDCKFCKAGGLKRLLTREEILGQVYLGLMSYHASEVYKPKSETKVVVNFTSEGDAMVFNLNNCCEAIKIMSRIEVGQSGINSVITSIGKEKKLQEYLDRYIDLPRVTHYWSLNSLDREFREKIMPFTRGHSLENIRDLYQKISDKTRRKVTASWIMIKGKTDRDQDIEKLQKFLRGRPFKVKVVALADNSLAGEETVSNQEVDIFTAKLKQAGISCRKRRIMGREIYSGCGNTIVEWLS